MSRLYLPFCRLLCTNINLTQLTYCSVHAKGVWKINNKIPQNPNSHPLTNILTNIKYLYQIKIIICGSWWIGTVLSDITVCQWGRKLAWRNQALSADLELPILENLGCALVSSSDLAPFSMSQAQLIRIIPPYYISLLSISTQPWETGKFNKHPKQLSVSIQHCAKVHFFVRIML